MECCRPRGSQTPRSQAGSGITLIQLLDNHWPSQAKVAGRVAGLATAEEKIGHDMLFFSFLRDRYVGLVLVKP